MAAPILGSVWEDGSATIYARIARDKKIDIVQSDVSSLDYTVWNLATDAAVSGHDGVALTISSVIFDTLQTPDVDPAYDFDDGYNFKHDLAYTAFPNGNQKYNYELTIVLTNGAKIQQVWELFAREVKHS